MYTAHIGTISEPVATGETREQCIDNAVREIEQQGGIGAEPHQWASREALIAALDVTEAAMERYRVERLDLDSPPMSTVWATFDFSDCKDGVWVCVDTDTNEFGEFHRSRASAEAEMRRRSA